MSNGNSFNGGSNYALGDGASAAIDPHIATMAWLFRRQVPAIP